MLIAIEGIDGSGKATLTRALAEEFAQHGHTVACESFPRYQDTSMSSAITDALARDNGLSPKAAAAMFAAERLESLDHLTGLLHANDVVLLDRYVHSNAAYQGGRGKDEQERSEITQWITRLEFDTFALPKPDLVVFVDTSVEQARERRDQRAGNNERGNRPEQDTYEANDALLRNAHNAFLAMSQNNDTCTWIRVDGRRPADELALEILKAASTQAGEAPGSGMPGHDTGAP